MNKVCKNCNFNLPIEMFPSSKGIKNNHYLCIECKRLYDRNYHNNRSEFKKKQKQLHQDTRRKNKLELVRNYKSNLGCCKCGEKDYACLDFHHISDDKEIDVGLAASRNWSIERLAQEIAKCIVICANCHRKLHRDEKLQGKARVEEHRSWAPEVSGQNTIP